MTFRWVRRYPEPLRGLSQKRERQPRKASQEFRVVYRADGSVVEIRGLAEAIMAARMKNEAGSVPSLSVRVGGPESSEGRPSDRRAHQKGHGTCSADVKLGDYALGSPQSRAAVRALLASKRAADGEGTLFVLKAIGSPAPPGAKCTCPIPPAGTTAICKCFYETK